jgi:nicotinamidase-related amidase
MGITFDPSHTVVLALDCQTGVISIYAKPQGDFITRVSNVLNAARAAGMAVIHVQVGFRPGLPEVSDRNKLLGAIKASKPHQEFFQGWSDEIHPVLGPKPDDIVVVKRRVSAFAGKDLKHDPSRKRDSYDRDVRHCDEWSSTLDLARG